MKKFLSFILVLIICLSFSSCEKTFLSVNSLMRPPKLSGDDRLLQTAFENSVSEYESVVTKTPISGKYRSSYILFDVDNDNIEEAIVIFSVPAKNDLIEVLLFKKINNVWEKVSSIKSDSNEIYEVNFADINGDNQYELLLSWTGSFNIEDIDTDFNFSHNLMVYSFDGKDIECVFTETYSNLFIADLNNNKSDEIVIFKTNLINNDNRTTIRILSFNNNYSVKYDISKYITGMIEIENIVSDRILVSNNYISRVYVDGIIGENGIITEIIEINEYNFDTSLPLYEDNQTSNPKTFRSVNITCIDIDNDGYVEIPNTEIYPYAKRISENSQGSVNLIVWSSYKNNMFSVDFKCLIDAKLGFLLVIPDEFIDNVSIIYDVDNLNLTFYSIDSNGSYNNVLFSCKIFTLPDWEENRFNYQKHYENDTYVYGYLIFNADNHDFYENFIQNNFYAL